MVHSVIAEDIQYIDLTINVDRHLGNCTQVLQANDNSIVYSAVLWSMQIAHWEAHIVP